MIDLTENLKPNYEPHPIFIMDEKTERFLEVSSIHLLQERIEIINPEYNDLVNKLNKIKTRIIFANETIEDSLEYEKIFSEIQNTKPFISIDCYVLKIGKNGI